MCNWLAKSNLHCNWFAHTGPTFGIWLVNCAILMFKKLQVLLALFTVLVKVDVQFAWFDHADGSHPPAAVILEVQLGPVHSDSHVPGEFWGRLPGIAPEPS